MASNYRIETINLGQYLKKVNNEKIKIGQEVQREFCWTKEMMNSLIYSVLSGEIFIPNIILAEEKQCSENYNNFNTYVVDGIQRTQTLLQFKFNTFKTTSSMKNYIIKYKKEKLDEYGNVIRNQYGELEYMLCEFDIRKKRYSDLPDELKDKFDECQIALAVYQNCENERISDLVMMYNNHMSMTLSQKSFTYIPKFAKKIKEIRDSNRFLKDSTILTENEKIKGIWEKTISECVMIIFHLEHWKSSSIKISKYLNENATLEEFNILDDYFKRLSILIDKLKDVNISNLLTHKNLLVWLKLFDIFNGFNLKDEKFYMFLNEFSNNLKNICIYDKSWIDLDNIRNTRQKKLLINKVEYLKKLMLQYFNSKNIKFIMDEQILIFIKLNVKSDVILEDIKLYKDILYFYFDKNNLFENEDIYSLLAIVSYAIENEIDNLLDILFKNYKLNNYMNLKNQSEKYQNLLNILIDIQNS